MKKKQKSVLLKILKSVVKLHFCFWGIVAALCVLYQFVNPPITPIMLHRYFVRKYDWHKRYYLPIEKTPNRCIQIILMLEDPNYYQHWGFDWKSIKTALRINTESKKIKFGASTISNQLARTIFLTTHRNYLRKYLEFQVTIIMEMVMTKKRMMELYVNYIELGKGIYGLDTASRYYYGVSLASLDMESTFKLASIITTPIKHTPHTFYKSRSALQRYLTLKKIY